MIDLCNVCKACKKSDLIMTNGACGFPTCGAGNSFKDFSPREKQTSKTLLDEFAMAAMEGMCANAHLEQFAQDVLDKEYDNDDQMDAYACVAYDLAAAMMKERNRRDEMGNVKEANT